MSNKVIIKSKEEQSIMKEGAEILKKVFAAISDAIRVGSNAAFIDQIAYKTILQNGAKPSFLGYRGYKYTTCISKNEEIVHGIPHSHKEFFPGDIVSIDCGVFYKGFHTDCARTFCFDSLDPEVDHLVKVTEESFFKGIEGVGPGSKMGEISNSIQAHIESNNLTVVKDLYSHGVGKELHEEPLIPNYGNSHDGITLKPGMTFAIEPMVNIGTHEILTLDDKWTIITADHKWSCHYENTILVTDKSIEILTI